MKTLYIFFVTILLGLQILSAQVAIKKTKLIENLRTNTTYLIIDDFGQSIEEKYVYKRIFEENWTIGPLEIISREYWENIPLANRLGKSFVDIDGYERAESSRIMEEINFNPSPLNRNPTQTVHYTQRPIEYTYLGVYTYSGKKYKRDYYGENVVRLELMKARHRDSTNSTVFWNWGPGICKNYIQYLMLLLEEGKKVSLYGGRAQSSELNQLAVDTLYVPTYLEYKFHKNEWYESKENDLQKLFRNYPFPWKPISLEELNKKILQEEKPFYYFLHIMTSGERYVNVVNARTGELVYRKYRPSSYNLGSGSIMNLVSAIRAPGY